MTFVNFPARFWQNYDKWKVSEDFKELVSLLLAPDPGSRPTMADILGHEWMREEVVTTAELTECLGKVMEAAEAHRNKIQ